MSREIAQAAIRGAHAVVSEAEEALELAVSQHGENAPLAFPGTAYSLPFIFSLTGERVESLGALKPILAHARELLPEVPPDSLWLPYLGDTLDAGIATLLAEESIEAIRYLQGGQPEPGCNGFITDTILRTLGVQLVDGTMPGFAVVVGAAPDNRTAVEVARELQRQNILIYLVGSVNGRTATDQLLEEGVKIGWETRLVPLGRDTIAAIYALNWAARAALTFGGLKGGDYRDILLYCKNRVFAFVLGLGEVDDLKYATAAGAISFGFPAVCDTPIPEILPTGICTYEHVVRELDHSKIVPRCIEVRGVKTKVAEVPIPVHYGPAFEGERIRKGEMRVEFGGPKAPGFEFVTMRDSEEVEDGKITLIGPNVDEVPEGTSLPIGLWVEVFGRKMQEDFEPILERQIHRMTNGAMGVWHNGQRDINWLRISKGAFDAGFRAEHLGEIIHARFINEYPAIVDKVQVTIYTEAEKVLELMEQAREVYYQRDRRIGELTDDKVEVFYSCLLCQSFAPNHVCIITPERLGLCGAYNWLDGKAAHEIDPTGPNQPVKKGECLDPVRGEWSGVNEFLYRESNQTTERLCMYSMLENPMTSCGCFECIMAVLPGTNGIMVVERDYLEMTPAGMTFSTLADTVGGGHQTPGFMGIGKYYVGSRKFISAEGGLGRLVWMNRHLKEQLSEMIEGRASELGLEGFLDKIADETVTTDLAELAQWLAERDHPALSMPELI
ncbi:MAG: acetyl-CoA decarbonylase/synthase complex subunit alpha/beta [Nitrospinota bacterium]